MKRLSVILAIVLFAITNSALSKTPTMDELESLWAPIIFCLEKVLKDTELEAFIYEKDVEDCKSADKKKLSYADRNLSEKDARRLRWSGVIESHAYSRFGGVDLIDYDIKQLDLLDKIHILKYCRKICQPLSSN